MCGGVIGDPPYTLYRLDKTKASHPPDPDNPGKYRTRDSGVLIAVKNGGKV